MLNEFKILSATAADRSIPFNREHKRKHIGFRQHLLNGVSGNTAIAEVCPNDGQAFFIDSLPWHNDTTNNTNVLIGMILRARPRLVDVNSYM